MLAVNNLSSNYRQTETINEVLFSDDKNLVCGASVVELDIQKYDGPVKTYVNEYVTYLEKRQKITL